MARQVFHEPMVEQQAIPIRGFQIDIGGTYVLMDDVITSLHQFAEVENAPDVGRAAEWLRGGEQPQVPAAGASFDQHVDRVEVYPDDPMAVRPRWIARTCNSDGIILHVTNGAFDQEYVIQDAQSRWPDKPVHLLTEAGQDTVWEEQDPGGIRSASNGRRRPSPNRLWA